MKALNTFVLSTVAVASGSGAAFLLAPILQRQADPQPQMQAHWERNYPTLHSMTSDADLVVLATVTGTVLGRVVPTTDEHVLPFTYVDLAIERVLRGSAGASITLEQTGGRLDDRTLYSTDDGGPYLAGERVLLFLKEQPGTGLYYLPHPKGRYLVEDGVLQAVVPADPVAKLLDLRRVDDLQRLLPR